MTDDRFLAPVNGLINHPKPDLRVTRLIAALEHVVKGTGKPGDDALETYCRDR